jgi:hypothetical protein
MPHDGHAKNILLNLTLEEPSCVSIAVKNELMIQEALGDVTEMHPESQTKHHERITTRLELILVVPEVCLSFSDGSAADDPEETPGAVLQKQHASANVLCAQYAAPP